MSIDKVFYIILFIPLFWIIVFDQQNLKNRKTFIKYFLISVLILIIGVAYEYYSKSNTKSLVYFGSQMTIIFLILYKIIREPYFKIYNREPEISKSANKVIDLILTFLIIMGTITLPFLIDSYLYQWILN